MGSRLHFVPLLDAGPDGPVCHLLRADDFNILLGCGWDERFSPELLQPVIREIGQVDAVLLSHGELSHLGALPYLVSKCGLGAHVYSTGPTRRMGEMFLRETVQAKQASSDFDVISMEDIEKAFSDHPWTQLRYHQHFKITEGKLAGVTLTPFNAGHMVGGSVWKITLPDGSDIVYAVDWCHKKERHLNKGTVADLTNRPALLIASAAGCLAPSVSAVRRDTEMLEVIIATLRGDGCVLIPVDTAGRVLEVALLLEEFWAQEKMAYPLVLLSHTGSAVLEQAQQQLEWMSDHITAAFGAKRDNPFDMRFLKTISSLDQLHRLPAGPKVVLACGPSLECGFARDLLLEWAPDARNTVCFVDRSERGTLADTLQRHVAGPEQLVLTLDVSRRTELAGAELEAYMRQQGQAVEVEAEDDEAGGDDAGAAGGAASGPLSGAPSLRASLLRREASAPDGSGGVGAMGMDGVTMGGSGGGVEGVEDEEEAVVGLPVLVDGFEPPQGCAAPMFPDEDEEMVEAWDAYGSLAAFEAPGAPLLSGSGSSMDAGCYAGSYGGPVGGPGEVRGPQGGAQQAAAAGGGDGEPEDEEPPVLRIPTRLVASRVALRVAAALRFFDFSGRADGPILRKSLADAAPRALVLVRGSDTERSDLSRHCESALSDLRCAVSCPRPGQAVRVLLLPVHTVFLSDALNRSVGLQRMQRYALAQLEATVGAPDPHYPALPQLLPSTSERSAEDVFIADSAFGIQLSHIKQALFEAGLESVFQGGSLVCGSVAISKGSNDKAHLVLEGALCDDFYRVREVIYSQYSVC
ncbi:hypothetical protein FOA52_000848 [Chlamydomonas sp. UWO 241]|nr:hypothetical protein FOA52_000848 [Chlamydomonas sp. UWO 241]